jgi:hypothetical protein
MAVNAQHAGLMSERMCAYSVVWGRWECCSCKNHTVEVQALAAGEQAPCCGIA